MYVRNILSKVWKQYVMCWDRCEEKNAHLCYVIHYTIVFVFLWCIMHSTFAESGKTHILLMDGMEAHFPRLIYISQVIREGIQSLLTGNGWKIPMYDFRTGLVAQDLQIGFPQILAILFPWDKIHVFYEFYVLFIYYLDTVYHIY